MNIFELLNEKYILPSKPKLFEAFSGIGCQRLAFNRLGLDYESVGISEIEKDAILSYSSMHTKYKKLINVYEFPSIKEMVDTLQSKNVGYDFKKQKHMITMNTNLDKVKSYYLADILSKNYGDISKIKGTDLPQIDVFTWSFPCTDLSKAGKQKGLDGTRSGLVYEVLRIMQECKANGNLPKVLIMENVVDLIQVKFIREFQEIQLELEGLGYTNYTQTLNAKDYGVAQNRDRVFMVSILGDYYYEFPKPIKLEKRLKDYLESEVDPKYYLSDKMLNCFTDMTNRNGLVRGDRFNPHDIENSKYAFAITTLAGNRATDNFIKMPEDTKQGYAKAYDGDGVYINRPHQKRGVVQDGMIQTLKTSCADVGVVIEDIVIGSSQKNAYQGSLDGICSTLTSAMGMGGGQTPMVTENNRLRIRKLTPLECWRLMGIDDKNFHKASKVCSNGQLYRQSGNGIVIDVFASIVSTMQGEQNEYLYI